MLSHAPAAVTAQGDAAAVLDAHLAIGRTVLNNDPGAFASLTTDDFISIDERGALRTKAQRLAELTAARQVSASSPAAATATRPAEWLVTVHGDVAVTTYRRDTSNPPARLMRVFVKRDGRWLMAASQITPIMSAAR